MAEIQVQSDFAVNGAVVISKDFADFPANPRIGTLVIKEKILYGFLNINGLETWYPFSTKTNSYIHSQGGANITWTVNHNLNTTDLFIQILDSSGNIITAAKQTVDNNTFRLLFTEAVTGTVLVVAPDSINVPTIKSTLIEIGPNVTIDTTGFKVNGAYALTAASISQEIANAVNSNVTYANVRNKPNTVAGFGITDAYTKADVDNAIANVASNVSTLSTQSGNVQNDINSINQTLAGLANVATSGEYSDLANTPALANVAIAGTFASLTSIPTSISGYGITDAYTMSQANVHLGTKANTASTLSGYGITDAYTMAQANVHLGNKANTASTLSGYGITDAYTMAQANVHLGLKANTSSLANVATSGSYNDLTNKPTLFSGVFADLTSKPTTLSGYGIVDAYTMSQANSYVANAISNVINGAPAALDTLNEIATALGNDANLSTTLTTLIASKANTSSLATVATSGSYADLTNKPNLFSGVFADLTSKPTTISGYGITDAYTMAQANVHLGTKANTASTLSGYGITDAYTMAQANVHLGLKANTSSLANVATSGSYADLTNKPSLFSGVFADLTSKPTTISGYGITDAYTMAQANTQIALKANVTDLVVVSNTAPILAVTTGNTVALSHATSGVSAGTYGGATAIPVISVNASGHVTSVSNVTVTTGTTITDETTSASTFYPALTTATTGSISAANVSSTKLSFVPSTGTLTATNLNSTSDRRHKTNIKTIEDSLGLVESLRGVTFDWVDTGLPSIGLIAQEVEDVLPELVSTNEEGVKSVSYSNLVGVLIEAVKEQQAQIDELRAMVLNLTK